VRQKNKIKQQEKIIRDDKKNVKKSNWGETDRMSKKRKQLNVIQFWFNVSNHVNDIYHKYLELTQTFQQRARRTFLRRPEIALCPFSRISNCLKCICKQVHSIDNCISHTLSHCTIVVSNHEFVLATGCIKQTVIRGIYWTANSATDICLSFLSGF